MNGLILFNFLSQNIYSTMRQSLTSTYYLLNTKHKLLMKIKQKLIQRPHKQSKQNKKLIIDVDDFLELFNFIIAIKMEYFYSRLNSILR